MYQPCRHLSKMHTTNYVAFYGKRQLFDKNSEPVGRRRCYISAIGTTLRLVGLWTRWRCAKCGRPPFPSRFRFGETLRA